MNQIIYDKKNILVAGGAGFIGSNLCERLVKDNKVICVDNFVSGQEANIDNLLSNPNFLFLRHDLTKPLVLENYPGTKKFKVEGQGIQEVYNFACPSSSKHFENFKIETILANSHVTKNILDLAVKYKAKLVHGSTSSIYGSPLEGQRTFDEKYWGFIDPVGPRACYNEGKRFAESLIVTYREKHKLDFKIARIFNTYGPKMKLDSGRMIPDFVNAAINNIDLEIKGSGQEISSYCYIADMLDGIVKLMDSPEYGPINLGNQDIYTLEDIAKDVIEIAESDSKISYGEPLPYLNKQGLPDISLAKEKLAWFPVIKLKEGLSKTIEDMKGARVITYTSEKSKQENNEVNSNHTSI